MFLSCFVSFIRVNIKFLKSRFISELILSFVIPIALKKTKFRERKGTITWCEFTSETKCTYCFHSRLLINKSWGGSFTACSVLDSCNFHYQEKKTNETSRHASLFTEGARFLKSYSQDSIMDKMLRLRLPWSLPQCPFFKLHI